ncbi:MAG: hypothetical protein LBU32_14700 [Clostridiales bacterium]|nr:hypothetical protein [Clostridiales bacterium]
MPVANDADELEDVLERVERMDLEGFIIPDNCELECRRIYDRYGLMPDPIKLGGHFLRDPVIAATSLMNTEEFLVLYYTDFRRKLPFLELDYSASAIDIGISYRSMDNKAPKKEHLMKIGI